MAKLECYISQETSSEERSLYLKCFCSLNNNVDTRDDLKKIMDLFLPSDEIDVRSLENLLASHTVICCTNDQMKNKYQMRPLPGSGIGQF